jgi:hypothetical protein
MSLLLMTLQMLGRSFTHGYRLVQLLPFSHGLLISSFSVSSTEREMHTKKYPLPLLFENY